MSSNKQNTLVSMKGLIRAFSFVLFLVAETASAQNKLGVVSEIVMASECLNKPNYTLFFESEINTVDKEQNCYWYKIAFHKDCFMKFTLVPNHQTDRYKLNLYRTPKYESFCDINEKIEDIEEQVTFKDTYQSDTFRQSIVYTKAIEVSQDDAVYIFICNLKGSDRGHVLEMITCNDYSYILKVNKESGNSMTDSNSVIVSENYFYKKICSTDDSGRYGYITADQEKITVNNFNRNELDSIYFVNKPIISADSTNGMYSDSLNILSSAQMNNDLKSLLQNNTIVKNDTNTILNTPQHHIAFEKLFQKSFKTAAGLQLSEEYSHFLKYSNDEDTENKSSVAENRKEQNKRKAKKAPKPLEIHLVAVDTETKYVVKSPVLRLLREPSLNRVTYAYNDSLALFSAEINANEKHRIECDQMGFKNYTAVLDLKNVIVLNNEAYYIIPMQPMKPGDRFIIPNIYFYPNLPVFSEQSYDELNKLAKYMNNNDIKVLIAGHSNGNKYISKDKRQTDETLIFSGTAKKLSRKRAEAVMNYLVKSGVEKNRIKIKGYGGKKPVIKEPKNKKEGEKNMRVEVFIVK